MDAERWRAVCSAFDELTELEPALRAERLAALASRNPELHREVAALLQADAEADERLASVTLAFLSDVVPDDPLGLRGRTVAHFRIVEPLGSGGMGAVYAAEDTRLGRTVALKVPLLTHRLDSTARQRFLQEARTIGALDHPCVCGVYECGESEDGLLYLAMPLCRGETLKVRLARDGRLPVTDALDIVRRILDGLDAAHQAGIVHRDLKPANVMLLQGGGVKVLDFGLAKVRDSSLTGSTAVLGTASYMSPEQIGRDAVDARADLWSLGVVLYEMLTGRLPFEGEHEVAVAHAIVHEEPLPPASLRPDLPPALEDLVLALLEKDPGRRPPTAKAVATELDAVAEGRGRRHARRLGRRVRAVGRYLAAGALLLVTALGIALAVRAGRAVAEPSLVGAGVLAPKDRILIADFADLAGDPRLAAAVTEAFRVDLAESPLVRVLSPRQVRAVLTRMQQTPDVALDDSLAREVALREGVKAFVTGSVGRVPGSYTISLQLLGATNGDLLVGLREAATDSNDVIGAVDRLSERLRARMGEPIRELRAEPPLAQVTTPSLDALRDFSEGQRLINSGDRFAGIARLERAVAIDTGFASAWRVLGVTLGDVSEDGRRVQAMEHALANHSRLPFHERQHTIASYAANVTWDVEASVEAYRTVLERYPDDIRALNNLAQVLKGHRRFAEAETLFTRAMVLDTSIAAIPAGLSGSLVLQGKFEEARRLLDLASRRFPGHFSTRLAEIYLAAARQDWAAADSYARVRLAADPSDTLDALDGNETIAGLAMTQGRLREAEGHSETVLRLSRLVGSAPRHFSSAIRLGYLELRYRASPERAMQRVESGLAAFPLESVPEGDRPYLELARFFAAAGHPARARELVERESRTELGRLRVRAPVFNADRRWARGRIALAEGRPADALLDLRPAADSHLCTICVLPDLARAYEAAGQVDSAAAAYERYLATPWEWRFEPDAIELGTTLRRLGELYELRGEPARARDAYERLLRLWHRGDAELEPILSDVRERLAASPGE